MWHLPHLNLPRFAWPSGVSLTRALCVRQRTDQKYFAEDSYLRLSIWKDTDHENQICNNLRGLQYVNRIDCGPGDSTSDTSHAVAYVKDSAVTTDIKTKLAAEHITSLQRIHVETDKDGVVWLSGSASTQKAADKAVAIARATDRVTNVHSDISVKSAD